MKAIVCWILLGIVSTVGLGLQYVPSKSATSEQKRNEPNVLFIVVDDLRTDLGCYGDSLAHTPNIDKLARTGVVFDRAYCQQAVCAPSRASMLTGLRPDSLRVWDLNTPIRTHLANVVTLPQYFKQQGYVTQCIGKIFHDPADHQDAQSWSVPEQLHITDDAGGKYVLPENIRNGGKGFWKAAPTERAEVPDSAYVDGRVALAAVRALEKLRTQPFFLAVGFRRPHLPFSAPERHWKFHKPEQFAIRSNEQLPMGAPVYAGHESSELRGYTDVPPKDDLSDAMKQQLRHGYYASTSYVDAQVGLVLQKIRQLGLASNTIVVLVSDHGFHLGEQGLWTKTSNYELDVRVPLIVSAPAQKARGKHTKALVELIDLFPTLTDLCQIPTPKQIQGKSFKKLVDNPGLTHRSSAISQFPRPWTYKKNPELIGYSIRNQRFRYTEWRRYQDGNVAASELYDLEHEPIERTNLSGQSAYRNILKDMSQALHNEIPAKPAPLQRASR
ncbi:sulfatase [Spirosoma sp. BT702]|uniref:Sulfatase n=1 Tax=Spirosoma profusum TaxID=2771354 RepID=A0A926XZJ7_9BACT|nr:sulfatase [Spirosoma profusum]MBD2703839.1 sulfatase [Spirosoma profusum]